VGGFGCDPGDCAAFGGAGNIADRLLLPQAAALAIVAANRDLTLAESRSALAEQQVEASLAGRWRFFRRPGIRLRKNRRTPQSRIALTF